MRALRSLAMAARRRVVWVPLTLLAVLAIAAGTTLAVVGGRAAHAATVISTCDYATLAHAISTASSGDTLQFGCSGTIAVTSTLTIGTNLTLDGTGQSVTLDGGNSVQVLAVSGGVTFTLTDVTIAHGNGNLGGGLSNGGTLTATGDTFTGNTGQFGGGLYNGGTATITNSTFSGNNAVVLAGGGAGLYADSGTLTTISGSTFSGNTSPTDAGGLKNNGTMTIDDSTFTGNTASSSLAGGLENNGELTITGTTVSGNSAQTGGGIYDFGTLGILNSTVSGNTASNDGGGLVVTNNNATAEITNSTIAANTIATPNPFIIPAANVVNEGGVTFANSIIANGTNGGDCAGTGTFTDSGYNLDSDGSCGFATANHDLPKTNPQLGALASNGGPTQTMALLPGSPAIDAGGTASNNCPSTDQRGVTRPQGAACDMGAFELAPIKTTTTLAANPNVIDVGQTVALCATVTPASGTTKPAGKVTFKDGTTTLGTATLSGGKACLSTSALALGTHGITAAYGGEPGLLASTSAPATVIVGATGQDVLGGGTSGTPQNPPSTSGSTGSTGSSGDSGQASGSGQQNPPAVPSVSSHHVVAATGIPLWLPIGALVLALVLLCGGLGAVVVRARARK